MANLQIGDRIRFLNTIGGGKVKGFQNKHIAIVEDETGFDVPVMVSECVVVEPASSNNKNQKNNSKEYKNENPPIDLEITKTKDEVIETPEGEKITTCLVYLPIDYKNLSYECYFVNDSNYYLYLNYMSRENNSWKSRYNGLIEPNTKMFLEEFDKTIFNEIEKICVQFIAFKRAKSFNFKNSQSVELRIDTVKFYKLHSFQENDYFDENALVYYITKNDIPQKEILISAGDIEKAMLEKAKSNQRPRISKINPKEKSAVIEVDLHIHELIDSTIGLENADMLALQLQKVEETMNKYVNQKNQKIVFIHGKGNGVLKSELMKLLKKKYPKVITQDASFQQYGYGATMVIIK